MRMTLVPGASRSCRVPPERGVLPFAQTACVASPPQRSAPGREIWGGEWALPPLEAYAGHLPQIGESPANGVLPFDRVE